MNSYFGGVVSISNERIMLVYLFNFNGSFLVLGGSCRDLVVIYLPAATKLGQGNVFTGICDSVHRGGLPQCMLGYPPPPDQIPTPPRPDTPPDQTSPSPLDQTSPSPLDQTPPPPRPGTPPPPRPHTPGSRRQHTVNERPVRILLECILVCMRSRFLF